MPAGVGQQCGSDEESGHGYAGGCLRLPETSRV